MATTSPPPAKNQPEQYLYILLSAVAALDGVLTTVHFPAPDFVYVPGSGRLVHVDVRSVEDDVAHCQR